MTLHSQPPRGPVSRRDFLRRTGVGAVGAVTGGLAGAAALLPGRARASTVSAGPGLRRLGRTDLLVSEIALGCGAVHAGRRELLEQALDAGINLLDTAPAYGDGAADECIGCVLSERGLRDRVVLMSREVGLDHEFLAGQPEPVAERAMTAAVDASLRRLRTDHLDILVCPQAADDAEQSPYPQIRSAMDKLRRAGKIRFFALACHENCAEVSRAAILGGFYDVLLTVLNPVVLEPDLLAAARELGRRRNEFLVAQAERIAARQNVAFRGPRAKARRRARPAPDWDDMREIPPLAAGHDVGLIAVRAANARFVPPELEPVIAERFGLPGATHHQTLYRYVLGRPEVASVDVGVQNIEQLRETLGTWAG